MLKMKEKIQLASEYMQRIQINQGRDWISPTEIGREVGGFGKHSSYGSPICKEMVKQGLVERNDRGHYRLLVIL